MPKQKAPTKKNAAKPTLARDHPEVIVDFDFDHGLFHVAVVNVSDWPAYEVSVQFDQPFCGLGGVREMSSLPLFRCIEFLAPRKRIETFLDSSSAYFQRGEPSRISAIVLYRDVRRRVYERRMVHDLSIYEDVSYVLPRTSANQTENPSHIGESHTTHGERTPWQSSERGPTRTSTFSSISAPETPMVPTPASRK